MSEPTVTLRKYNASNGEVPVFKDGKRLAWFSSKSHYIHVADAEGGSGSYDWAECGQGGRKSDRLYIDPEKFTDDYLIRDGDIIGEFCSICTRGLPEDGQ